MTHTESEAQPWWQLELASRTDVSAIVLHNRTDCCAGRLSDVHVFVSDSPFGAQSLDELLARDDIYHEYLAGEQSEESSVSVRHTGRYIRIQLAGTSPLSLAEVQVFGEETTESTVNAAADGIASQSSTAYGAVANRAIDGNTDGVYNDGSVTHTARQTQPWWQLALAQRTNVTHIVLHNRTDCCASRLSDVHVFVSESPFGDQTLDELLQNNNIHHTNLAGAQANQTRVSVNRTGRYVRVQLAGTDLLSLAEVQVFGEQNTDPLSNLAAEGSAGQSSTSYGGVASRAIDGNTNGTYTSRSVTHTATQGQPWWQMELADRGAIEQVVLYNRTDSCCTSLLADVHVFVSDSPFGEQSLDELLSQSNLFHVYLAGEQGAETVVPVNSAGRYVRVQLAGTSALSLAEVEVMGVAGVGR